MRVSRSCLLTWSRFGPAGGSASSSLAVTLLFRFVKGLSETVAAEGKDAGTVGIKTRLEGGDPVVAELDAVVLGIVGSKEDNVWGRFSTLDLKMVDIGSVHPVGDSADVLE